VEAVCVLMSDGLSLRKSCEKMGLSPNTVLNWIDASEALKVQYTHARARLIDAQAEELEEIGDQAAMAQTAVEVNGLRLKSDNRKWLLSKLAPKKYGDKLAIGGDENMPPIQSVTRIELIPLK
jgi:transposase